MTGGNRHELGFVGLGIIGSAFSKHLCARGFDVCGYDPERARSNLLQRRGGRPLRSAAAVAGRSDVVITALASYGVYEAAYFGSGGIVAGAHRGLIVAGFESPTVTKVSQVWRLPAGDGLFNAMKDSTVRTAGLLRAQKPTVLGKIRDAMRAELANYTKGDRVELPMPALIVSGLKP